MSEPIWPRDAWLAMCRRILRRASASLGPLRDRAWIEEWEAELWALHSRGAGRAALLRFAVDGWFESRWERRRERRVTDSIAQTFRHALRRLRRSPGFTAVAVLVLGLGIGANAALFSALRAALLDGLPYPESDRLVIVDALIERPNRSADTLAWSWPKFIAARESMVGLDRAEGFFPRTATLTGSGEASRVGLELVTAGYFDLLGVRAQRGRTFRPEEERAGEAAVVVLGHGLWTTRFGADPGVIGRTIVVEDASLEIVGVAPPGFQGLSGGAEVFVPVAAVPLMRGGTRRLQLAWSHWLRVVGRLEAGVSIEEARVRLAPIGTMLTETFPPPSSISDAMQSVTVVPLDRARVNATTRMAVAAVSVAGVLLLLIACGNVAGLLLARAMSQRTDTAVRAALGAGRGQLVRESLAESSLLAIAGGALGLFLAFITGSWIAHAAGYALDAEGDRSLQFVDTSSFGVDASVLLAGVVLIAVVTLVAGLLPARVAARPDVHHDLRSGARLAGTRRRDGAEAGRAGLVIGQVALTLLLLAGTGLLAASFARLSAIDVGFTHRNVLTFRYERGPAAGGDNFERALLERLRALPGVESAAAAPCAPLAGVCEITGLRRVDDRDVPDAESAAFLTYAVSDGYFETLGIPLRSGRSFDARDGTGTGPVAVINEAAARLLFPGSSPIGHRIGVTHDLTAEQPAEIVGVVADVPYGRLEGGELPAIFLSRRQAPSDYGTIFTRVAGEPSAVLQAARSAVASLDPALPIYDVTTIADLEMAATARTRVVLWLLAVFAGTGLLLSAVGLYGLVSYAIAGRTREMGLRLALGAGAADVLRITLAPAAWLVVAGTALGVAGSLALTRFLAVLLYDVRPSDPRVLAVAVAVLLSVVILAAVWPARRATRVDPAVALRGD